MFSSFSLNIKTYSLLFSRILIFLANGRDILFFTSLSSFFSYIFLLFPLPLFFILLSNSFISLSLDKTSCKKCMITSPSLLSVVLSFFAFCYFFRQLGIPGKHIFLKSAVIMTSFFLSSSLSFFIFMIWFIF